MFARLQGGKSQARRISGRQARRHPLGAATKPSFVSGNQARYHRLYEVTPYGVCTTHQPRPCCCWSAPQSERTDSSTPRHGYPSRLACLALCIAVVSLAGRGLLLVRVKLWYHSALVRSTAAFEVVAATVVAVNCNGRERGLGFLLISKVVPISRGSIATTPVGDGDSRCATPPALQLTNQRVKKGKMGKTHIP